MLLNYFEYIFVHLRQKSQSQARIKPEIFVNFRPEADPKSPARLTTLRLRPELSPKFLSTLGPNPTRKADPTDTSVPYQVQCIGFYSLCTNFIVCAIHLEFFFFFDILWRVSAVFSFFRLFRTR